MIYKKSLLIATLCFVEVFFSVNAYAKNEVIVIGGGGEPKGDTTIFDRSMVNITNFTKGSGYSARTAFDGEHRETQKLNKSLAGSNAKTGKTADIENEIKVLTQRIRRGELKKGDQLLVNLLTHGAELWVPEHTHPVASADGLFNVSLLKSLISEAEKAGVKIAITDFSCYSGSSINLATDKTCVISAASENVGYINTADVFTAKLKKGKNLEDVFLEMRASPAAYSPGVPQISTQAGTNAYANSSFLSESMKERTTLTDDFNNGRVNNCGIYSPQYAKLDGQISKILMANSAQGFNVELLSAQAGLRVATENYTKSRDEAAKLFNTKKRLNKKVCLSLLANKPDICATYGSFEAGYKSNVERMRRPQASTAEVRQRKILETMRSKPEFMQWQQADKKYSELSRKMYSRATEVARHERIIYKHLYKHYSSLSTKPNPCKDFVL